MNELNTIYQKYQHFYPSLLAIETNKIIFKNKNHASIFSFLLGYFVNRQINSNDFNNIINKYQETNFNQIDGFSTDFRKIAEIFCQYFESKDKQNSIINNINNFNVVNFNINNSNNNNFPQENNNNNNNFNNDFLKQSNSQRQFSIFENSQNNMNINSKNNININNIKDNNFNAFNNNFININEIHNQINDIDLDYEYAKQLERDERENLNKMAKEDEKNQVKKCEICLEEFSLLDYTNYFLNCNCVLHNVCFDNLVKSAVENNSLPVKCPNCKIPVHPNFIEDSLRNANPQLFEKYEHFSMNNFIMSNNDEYSSCPTPGCEYMFFFNPGEHNFLCPLCNKNYCLNCKDEWHRGLTCQQYKDSRDVNKLDNQFFQFVKGAKFKMCPKCKYWVEKNQGCNHMRCRCGADFCYLCGEIMDMRRNHICRKK